MRLIRTFCGSFLIKQNGNMCDAYTTDGEYMCTINCSLFDSDESIANLLFNELLDND